MIIVDDVHKRYLTDHGPSKWVLQGASFVIPPKTNVGLVGGNGAGKSTLLRIIGGVDQPTRGRVERRSRVSWPMGLASGLQGTLTGRQNAKFICRIQGHEEHIAERLAFIQEFAEIGEAFDEPTNTYSSGMGARLRFAISLAFDFDVYISDELTAVGDAAFKKKAKVAFDQLAGRAGLIMVSHSESTLKEFCQAGVWLHEGRATWFDDINDALQAYRESQPTGHLAMVGAKPLPLDDEQMRKMAAQVGAMQRSTSALQKGLNGEPVTLDNAAAGRVMAQAKKIGMELLPRWQIVKRGYRLKQDSLPLLRRYPPESTENPVDLYDLYSQCEKVESTDND